MHVTNTSLMRVRFTLLLTLALAPGVARPQGGMPLGPEFPVNTYTTDQQHFPSIALEPSGNFVVVWAGNLQDGSVYGIFGQRYSSSGAPLGPEFRVNTFTTAAETQPSVAADAVGNFVVVWHSNAQDGSANGVFAQRYSSSGAPLGPEFRVNTYTSGQQVWPSVAVDPTGAFVVAWQSEDQDGSVDGIFAQRYSSSGAPLGPEFQVNSYTSSVQQLPSVAADASGNFVIAWASYGQEGAYSSFGVYAQRYDGSGSPLGPEFRANTYTTSTEGWPSVAADGAGNFIIAWSGSGAGDFDIFGQRFTSSGTPLGGEFRLNTYTTDTQFLAEVAADAVGNFVVVWQSQHQEGSVVGDPRASGVYGQRFSSAGAPQGLEFRVNTETNLGQLAPSVGAAPSGDFVVVWGSDQQDGSLFGVFGQRYGRIVPVELMGLRVE